MSRLGERLKEIIEEKYGGVPEFSRETGIPKTTVYNLIHRDFRGGNIDTVIPLCKALNIDTDALVGGTLRFRDFDPNYVDVPLYGYIAAGTPIEVASAEEWFPVPRVLVESHPNAFLLKVRGGGMDRLLPSGCLALVDPDDAEVLSGRVYALNVNGYDATLKHVEALQDGVRLVPNSSDPTIHPQVFDFNDEEAEDVTIIGRVVWATFPFDYEL